MGTDLLHKHKVKIDFGSSLLNIGSGIKQIEVDGSLFNSPKQKYSIQYLQSLDPFREELEDVSVRVQHPQADWSLDPKVQSLVTSFRDIFSKDLLGLNRVKSTEHRISLQSAKPIALPSRRLPLAQEQQVHNLINEWLSADLIEESAGPYAFPIVVVPK